MSSDDPPRLTLIVSDLMRIEGGTPDFAAACEREGFELTRDGTGHLCIRFASEPDDLRENPSAIRVLQFPISYGTAFARKYKLMYDPYFAVQYVRDVDLVEGPVVSCWFGDGSWHFEHES